MMPRLSKAVTLLPVCLALLATACGEPEESAAGKMNISCFVYRDVNRNGVYDIADRPYSGLNVRITDASGAVYRSDSNLAGFANFAMSAGNDAHPINAPGEYAVRAMVEPGWVITSGNPDQVLRIRSLPESPGGLVAEETLGQVGVAPALSVSGRVPAEGEYLLRPMGSRADARALNADEQGWFSLPVEAGNWEVVRRDLDGDTPINLFPVESYPVLLPDASRPGSNLPESVGHTAIFDDLTPSDTLYEVPSNYAGLDWHNWIATHHKFYQGYGYINATTSGEFSAYNSSGHPAEFSAAKPFDLVRVNIGVAWRQAENADIVMRAWRDGKLVYEDRFRALTSGPVTLRPNYRAVERVEIATETYWQVVIDDLVVIPR